MNWALSAFRRNRVSDSDLPGIFLHWQRVEKYMIKCNDNLWCHKINFIAWCVLKIKILRSLSRLFWLKYSRKFWGWCASDAGWKTRNMVTKCSAQLPNCCESCFLHLKCPFHCKICTLSNSPTLRKYFRTSLREGLPKGKTSSDILLYIKLIWVSRSDKKWISTKRRRDNFLMYFNSTFTGFHSFLEIKVTYRRTPFP